MDSETLEKLKKQIETVLSLGKGTKINLCYTIYKIIERVPDPAYTTELLQHTAEIFDDIESNEELEIESFINNTEQEVLKERYGGVIDKMFEVLLGDNLIEVDFYRELWNIVSANPMLRDEKARSFALYNILTDRRIPYFCLEPGLKMSNEDFRQRRKKMSQQLAKIKFIVARDFSQKTEKSSLILKELLSIESEEDRVVMLSICLSHADTIGGMAGKLASMFPDLMRELR